MIEPMMAAYTLYKNSIKYFFECFCGHHLEITRSEKREFE